MFVKLLNENFADGHSCNSKLVFGCYVAILTFVKIEIDKWNCFRVKFDMRRFLEE